jgi:hypothetical protein
MIFFDENEQIKFPSGGILHYFVKYNLGGKRITEIIILFSRDDA